MPYYGINGTTLYISNSYTSQATTSFSYPTVGYAWPWYDNRSSIKTVIILSIITPPHTNYMFYGFTALTTVQNASYIDTSNVTDMSRMFSNCESLLSLDVSNFDTSNVTVMFNMFYNCTSLTSIDVSNWNTSNVTDMSRMFQNCKSLPSLDVSNFDTSNVTTMRSMFNHCESLPSLDVSNFDTSNVTDMYAMFTTCYALTYLDVSNWNTSNVTSMVGLFNNACSLKTLNLNSWDVSKVTDMSYMFECDTTTSQLERIYCENVWTGASGVQSTGMFNGCVALKGAISYDSNKLSIEYANPNTGYFTKLRKPYFGVGGKAKRVKSVYIGIDGKAKKVTKAYIGIDNKCVLFMND